MVNPLAKNLFQVAFTQRDQEVEALSADRPHEPFASAFTLGARTGVFKARRRLPARRASRRTRECDHRETKRGRCPAWFCLALLKQGKLFPEEQILGHQGDMRGKEEPDERRQLRILLDLA